MRSVKFNNIELMTLAYAVESMPFSVPARRGDNIPIPYRDGARNVTRKPFESRTEVLNMWVGWRNTSGALPGGKTKQQQLELNIEYLKALFATSGQVALKIGMLDSTYRTAQAEVISAISFQKDPAFTRAKMSVELLFADPFFYGETLVTETINLTSGSVSTSLTNAGTAPVKKGTITITGVTSNCKINNTTNSISCTYTGVLADAVEAVISLTNQTVLIGGENYLGFLTHLGDPNWFVLNPGANAITITGDTSGGTVKLEYYPAYI